MRPILAIVGLLVSTHVGLLSAQLREDGALAPGGRWTVRGGSTSRSGAALTPALAGPVEVGWRYDPGGVIVGEPLVWDEQILLEVRTSSRHALHLVGLAEGKRLAKTRGFETRVALAPCIWNRKVAFRVGPNELAVFRMEERGLKRSWTLESEGRKGAFGEPLFLGREIYVRVGENQIRRYDFGRDRPVWTVKGSFRSELALRGDSVHVIAYARGLGYLLRLSRKTGETLERVVAAGHGDRVPTADTVARLRVGPDKVFMRHRLPVRFEGGGQANTTTALRQRGQDGRVTLSGGPAILLHDEFEEPMLAACSRGWVGLIPSKRQGTVLGCIQGDDEFVPLASRRLHPALIEFRAPPTVMGDVAYAGEWAIDLNRSQILWRGVGEPSSRLIPARGAALCVESGGKLVALRDRAGAGDVVGPRPATTRPATRAIAYLRDGSVVRGLLRISDGRVARIVSGKEERSWPLAEMLFVAAEDGTPIHHGGQADVARFAERLIKTKLASGYTDLASRAVRSNDPDLIGRLLGEAWMRGAEDKRLEKVERKLLNLGRRPLKVKDLVAADVRGREARLPEAALEEVWRRAQKITDPVHIPVKIGLLRAVLRSNPEHSEAVKAVRSLLPADIDAGTPFLALDWLDFVQAINETPISIVMARRADRDKTPEQVKLLKARYEWRDDLVGIQSKRLLIISPLARPGRIARTLSMGELICDQLERMFAAGRKQRMRFNRLVIHLFETQEEYVEYCGRGRPASPIQWTAGHYDSAARLSRMYVPEGDDAFKRVHAVFAHELTHQWIEERCPLFSEQDRVLQRYHVPGFWIVEGMASLVEEFLFDPETRRVAEVNRRSETIDVFGHLLENKDSSRIAWKDLFAYHPIAFAHKLDPKPDPRMTTPTTWKLGEVQILSSARLFYLQATAACLYLYHAENGAFRTRLIRYVRDHYTGRKATLSVEKAFGLSPAELGRRAEAFVREKAKAYRP